MGVKITNRDLNRATLPYPFSKVLMPNASAFYQGTPADVLAIVPSMLRTYELDYYQGVPNGEPLPVFPINGGPQPFTSVIGNALSGDTPAQCSFVFTGPSDTAALQAYLNAEAGAGRTSFIFRPGIYALNDTLILPGFSSYTMSGFQTAFTMAPGVDERQVLELGFASLCFGGTVVLSTLPTATSIGTYLVAQQAYSRWYGGLVTVDAGGWTVLDATNESIGALLYIEDQGVFDNGLVFGISFYEMFGLLAPKAMTGVRLESNVAQLCTFMNSPNVGCDIGVFSRSGFRMSNSTVRAITIGMAVQPQYQGLSSQLSCVDISMRPSGGLPPIAIQNAADCAGASGMQLTNVNITCDGPAVPQSLGLQTASTLLGNTLEGFQAQNVKIIGFDSPYELRASGDYHIVTNNVFKSCTNPGTDLTSSSITTPNQTIP